MLIVNTDSSIVELECEDRKLKCRERHLNCRSHQFATVWCNLFVGATFIIL